jgi:hypothetical protein
MTSSWTTEGLVDAVQRAVVESRMLETMQHIAAGQLLQAFDGWNSVWEDYGGECVVTSWSLCPIGFCGVHVLMEMLRFHVLMAVLEANTRAIHPNLHSLHAMGRPTDVFSCFLCFPSCVDHIEYLSSTVSYLSSTVSPGVSLRAPSIT